MSEQEIKIVPLDLDDLFGGDTVINLAVKGRAVRFTFAEKDSAIDLEYQRRLSKIKNNGGKVEPSDASLQTDLWLFNKLCKKVEVGAIHESPDRSDDQSFTQVADFQNKLPPDIKRQAIFYYHQRIAGAGGGEGN